MSRSPAPLRACLLGAITSVALLGSGCVRDMPSEERLDRDTADINMKPGISPEELAKVSCDDMAPQLVAARDVNRPETERVQTYMKLYSELKRRRDLFEDAFARNPDLSYDPASARYVAARDACVQQTADVQLEFETYTRELVEVPTVQEIKGGNAITVARLDFATLREAIDVLELDDREAMFAKLAGVEKRIESSTTRRGR